ncbi:MAG: hypothetical protein Q7J85_03460 [Bacillota bacterium]|nr:hypothetical protein [Bacillota bacterium]
MSLDEMLSGFRQGDNVVWQVDSLDEYTFFAEPFVKEALLDNEDCVYLRFAPHPPHCQSPKRPDHEESGPGTRLYIFCNRNTQDYQGTGRGQDKIFYLRQFIGPRG